MWYYVQNGQQVGPVSTEELQAYFQSQSLAVVTSVWRDGMPNWQPANQVPELMAGVAGGYLPQPAPGMGYMQPPQTNSMALTSMILGLLGVLGFSVLTSLPAIIFGHIARGQMRREGCMQTGEGMALTGLITGYLVTILSILFIIGFVIFFYVIFEAASSAGSYPPGHPGPTPPPSFPVPSSP